MPPRDEFGAPIVSSVADTFGPRRALGVGAASGFAAAIVVVIYLAKYCDLRPHVGIGAAQPADELRRCNKLIGFPV
jgi:hypothetical protein